MLASLTFAGSVAMFVTAAPPKATGLRLLQLFLVLTLASYHYSFHMKGQLRGSALDVGFVVTVTHLSQGKAKVRLAVGIPI